MVGRSGHYCATYLLFVDKNGRARIANVIKSARRLFTGHIHLALTRPLHATVAPDDDARVTANTSRSSGSAAPPRCSMTRAGCINLDAARGAPSDRPQKTHYPVDGRSC